MGKQLAVLYCAGILVQISSVNEFAVQSGVGLSAGAIALFAYRQSSNLSLFSLVTLMAIGGLINDFAADLNFHDFTKVLVPIVALLVNSFLAKHLHRKLFATLAILVGASMQVFISSSIPVNLSTLFLSMCFSGFLFLAPRKLLLVLGNFKSSTVVGFGTLSFSVSLIAVWVENLEQQKQQVIERSVFSGNFEVQPTSVLYFLASLFLLFAILNLEKPQNPYSLTGLNFLIAVNVGVIFVAAIWDFLVDELLDLGPFSTGTLLVLIAIGLIKFGSWAEERVSDVRQVLKSTQLHPVGRSIVIFTAIFLMASLVVSEIVSSG